MTRYSGAFMVLLADLSSNLFLAAILVLTWLFVRQTFSRDRESRERNPVSLRGAESSAAELSRWKVELYETAHDLKAELDTKASAVQALLRLAQAERERLEASVARAESLGLSRFAAPLDAVERISDGDACESPPGWRADSDRQRRVYQLRDEGAGAAEIARHTGVPLGEVELLLSLRS